MVSQKENDNCPENKFQVMENCDQDNRIQNSSQEKTQWYTRKLRSTAQRAQG